MGDRVLLEVSESGVAEYLHFDSDGNLEAIEWLDDAQDVLDANMIERNEGNNGYGQSREWQHLARVPMSLLKNWEIELGLPADFLQTKEGMPLLLKKIKDPDFKNLRTDK